MGLDWCVDKIKPRPGSERRFAEIQLLMKAIKDNEGAITHLEDEVDDSAILEKLKEMGVTSGRWEAYQETLDEELKGISVSCFEAAGAPQVGIDEVATEWFRKNCYDPAHEDAVAGKMHNPNATEFWKRTFDECLADHHGQYVMELARDEGGIASVSGVAVSNIDFRGKALRFAKGLPSTLVNESYEDHTAEECLTYAQALESALNAVEDGESREIVEDAIKWLRFWGGKGFGYHAWY